MPTVGLQLAVLVAASLFFYAWESPLLLLVFMLAWFITSVTSYFVLTSSSQRAKFYATIGVMANLSLLGFFKYKFLFIHPAHHAIASSLGEWLILAPLPIGISFYTFHGISLLVDSFRGTYVRNSELQIRSHLGETLLYLVFFPQLIAGPIIKARDFFPQVERKSIWDIDFAGCARILILGLFLKMVIADNLSEQTFWIAYPFFQWKSKLDLMVMIYGYSAQIFADFAGYSLIAIGLAKLLGYRLPQNFNFPYFSTSISDFWRRWHISLSSWLRDYLYIPLGGNRKGEVRTYVNLILVMLLGGLWHGAAWSFAIWGLWHGIGLALERKWLASAFMTSDHRVSLMIRQFVVFNFVTIGWVFFKLQDFSDATLYLERMVHNDVTGISKKIDMMILIYAAAVFIYHVASVYRDRITQQFKDVIYGVMLFFVITSAGPSTPFIYFQF